MQLTIELDPLVPSSAAVSHCFVSLPAAVASSLNEITPFSPLTVLRVQPSARHSDVIFVAWAGSVSQTPGVLRMHPKFASLVSLSPGSLVSVKVVERLTHSQAPKYPLRTATIRPISYDQSETNSHSTQNNSGDESSRDFELLFAAAKTLQQTLLPQVRVLFPGLKFPLALPASRTVDVRVVSIATPSTSDPSFAVVQPISEIIIEAPQSTPNSRGRPFRSFLRAFSRSLSFFPKETGSFHLTHALVPLALKSSFAERQLVVLVSRKIVDSDLDEEVKAIPIAASFSLHAPLNCILLPPFAWEVLKLTPLTPVFVEQITMPIRTDDTLKLNPLSVQSKVLPSVRDIQKNKAVFFQGLPLFEGEVVSDNNTNKSSLGYTDSWDDPAWAPNRNENINGKSSNDYAGAETFDAHWEFSFKSAFASSLSRRKVLPVFHYDVHIEENKSSRFEQSIILPEETIASESEDNDTTWTEKLISRLTPSNVEVIRKLLRVINSDTNNQEKVGKDPDGPGGCSVFVLEGASGSGKTHICDTLAAILRNLHHMRTVWIRGEVHAGESPFTLASRIEYALSAAVDGGPGIIILDDFDIMCGGRKGRLQSKDEPQNQGGPDDVDAVVKNSKALQLSNALLKSTKRGHKSHYRFLILTCEKMTELPSLLRSPGFFSHTLTVRDTTDVDRAHLLLIPSSMKANTGNEEHTGEDEDITNILVEGASSVAMITEGLNPHQLDGIMSSSSSVLSKQILSKSKVRAEDALQFVDSLRHTVSSDCVFRGNEKERTSTESGNEELSWNMLGGISSIRDKIMATIKLPAEYPDLFRKAPVQLPRGLLLFGPPGCGKTVIAKTATAEAGLSCVLVKGPELMSKYIGESEAQVRNAFSRAESKRPCVLLFDEFDALAPARGSGISGTTGVSDRVVNTLLTCLDGVEKLAEGVFIMATTSRPEVIDPALLRPGRLDRWIPVDLPCSTEERFEILSCLASAPFNVGSEIQAALQRVAEETEGYTGADLGAIINDAELSVGTLSDETSDRAIVQSLEKALQGSRPSLSKEKRLYYSAIMSRFGSSEDGKMPKRLRGQSHLPEELGTRLTLQ